MANHESLPNQKERLRVSGSVGLGVMGVGDILIDKLIENGDLPHDFEFRSLAVEPIERRNQVVAADIVAKIGFGEPSGEMYLDGPLPDCVLVPDPAEVVEVIKNVDDDYYRLHDFKRAAKLVDAPKEFTVNIWVGYVKEFNPALFEWLDLDDFRVSRGDPVRQFKYGIDRTIMRDGVLYERYRSYEHLLGAQALERRILHTMLLDNHMELGLLDDAT